MLQVDWLENHMDKCSLMAEWLYGEFSYEFAQQSLASWQQEFSDGQHDGRWKCLIATQEGQLLGGAALAILALQGWVPAQLFLQYSAP